MQTTTAYQIELFLIRHGKTSGNIEKRYIGRSDEHLSKEGISELKNKHLPAVDLYFASPMFRCVETAEVLFGKQKFIRIEQFREIDFGDFEGKNHVELSDNPDYQAWIDSGGTLPFPGGESREGFCKRSLEGFDEMLRQTVLYLRESRKVKVSVSAVVHGGTIMAIASELSGGNYYDFQVANGEAYKLILQVCEKATERFSDAAELFKTADLVDAAKLIAIERVTL